MVNLPPEESAPLKGPLDELGIRMIFLVAPTTTEPRARMIVESASGFVYYVSLKGTTGAGNLDASAVGDKLRWLRELTPLPLLVGFGIKNGADARAVSAFSDGVVVGSALVDTMARQSADPEAIPKALVEQVREIRQALDQSLA
jgi:tryptophan synthase alpha chain